LKIYKLKINGNIYYLLELISRYFDIKWGLGIGDWGLGPIPNPQSPIPKYLSLFELIKLLNIFILFLYLLYYNNLN